MWGIAVSTICKNRFVCFFLKSGGSNPVCFVFSLILAESILRCTFLRAARGKKFGYYFLREKIAREARGNILGSVFLETVFFLKRTISFLIFPPAFFPNIFSQI